MKKTKQNRKLVLEAVDRYWKSLSKEKFTPEKSRIPVSGKVIDAGDIKKIVDAALDGWFTEGQYASKFEQELAKYFRVFFAHLTNSGSSANLLALSALTSPKLKDKRLLPGDEVITVAAGFPTTVNPIIQNKLVPVFVDIKMGTCNIDVEKIEDAISDKTKAIMIAHALGNPFDLKKVMGLVKKYHLWLIEDCCDALGAKYNNKLVGTYGHLATLSFYPAHQITAGEGGAVITDNPLLSKIVCSFRDWGRDCWCKTGHDNTCRKRFGWKFAKLPKGFDHKYVYSHVGYNLKTTEMQAALGLSQLKKLPKFIKIRRQNFEYLYKHLKRYEQFFILPKRLKKAEPSWFGFLLIIKKKAPFKRKEIVSFLEAKKIATRPLFAGNLLNHPAYNNIRFRQVGMLTNTNAVMERAFWIGVYPGITKQMMKYVLGRFDEFMSRFE